LRGAMEQNSYKRCSECGVVKSLSEFHLTSRKYIDMDTLKEHTYEYHRSDCKDCRSKKRKKFYQEHRR